MKRKITVEYIDVEVEHEWEEREGTDGETYQVEILNVFHKGEDITPIVSRVALNEIRSFISLHK